MGPAHRRDSVDTADCLLCRWLPCSLPRQTCRAKTVTKTMNQTGPEDSTAPDRQSADAVPQASSARGGADPAEAATAADAPSTGVAPQGTSASGMPGPSGLSALPSFTRSLLRISVPVTVILAAKRQPISRIVEIVPGTIIQFAKSCDELLDLVAGEKTIGLGEAVKVGDKFGIRLLSLFVPPERFKPLRPRTSRVAPARRAAS